MAVIPFSMWIGISLTSVVMAVLGAFVSRPEWPRYQQAFVCAVALSIAVVLVAGYNDFGFLLHATENEDEGGIGGWNDKVTESGWTVITPQQRWAVRRSAGIATLAVGGAAAVSGAAYGALRRRPRRTT